jgi:CubicO group peptidase (beta-lactamase class C family)
VPADLQAVLTKDLAVALKSGALAPETHAGVAIGVIADGVPEIFTFGTAKADSIFEIGSISKTFTGLLLAQMIEQHKVTLDEPVRALLPPGTVAKPDGPEITLLDLTTQHSGLPRMPDNFAPRDVDNPYADFDAKKLYEFLGKHGVAKPPGAGFAYSNLGVGLLGQALVERAGTSYAALLQEQIAGPLGLADTTIELSPSQQARFIPCFDAAHRPAHAWDLNAFAGAGGIRSTAADMLKYLDAQLRSEKLSLSGPPGTPAATLPAAIALSQELRADVGAGTRIAFNWFYDSDSGVYWHNGATGGFTSYAFFEPKANRGAVVLVNTGIGPKGSIADVLGQHIRARFAGKPAIQLKQ